MTMQLEPQRLAITPRLWSLISALAPLGEPRIGFGQCLAPRFPSGTLFFIDASRKPAHGDLVWYHWPEAWVKHLHETYGMVITGGAKYFRVKGDRHYLESNEGMVPYKPDEWIIEGVVVGTFTFRHPPPELAEAIKRADADIAEAERKQKALGVLTPLDDARSVRYRRVRA
jgi:hypothetical protein